MRERKELTTATKFWAMTASMGPFSCENGKETADGHDRRIARSFNGAVLLRERKGGLKTGTPARLPGFNGAVLLRERKGRLRCHSGHLGGHASMGPFSCENGKQRVADVPVRDDLASMGPFSCENGKPSCKSGLPSCRRCFNGAVLLRERKESAGRRASARSDASMGPFSCENGKGELPSLSAWGNEQLQWGRSLARTERKSML